MQKGETFAKISDLGHRVAEAAGMELVQVDLERQRGGWFLRLYIDKPGGVTLGDCQAVSEQMGAELDVQDLIEGAYTLEVSSPGLDRPLRSDDDFRRFIGKRVALSTFEPIEGRRHFVGRLQGFESGVARLIDDKEAEYAIPRQKISKARLEVEF
ncbi:MAG TPA: ribosome maturation factor RimP [Candidatus Polarisedimenticolia bacterium]|nr:ribosome maturation factor RimP [Candidatus Polarisedimenticolia bacterium]